MPSQPNLPFDTYIDNHDGGTVNIFKESTKTESKTEGAQVKLTATQKAALRSVCQNEGVGVSTWIADAIELKLQLAPYMDKIKKYRPAIVSLLHRLP